MSPNVDVRKCETCRAPVDLVSAERSVRYIV